MRRSIDCLLHCVLLDLMNCVMRCPIERSYLFELWEATWTSALVETESIAIYGLCIFFIVFIKSCITSKHIFSNSIITEYFCDVVSDNHALAFAETTPLVPFSSTKQYRVFWLIVLNLDDMTSLLFWFLLCSQSAVLGQSTPLFSATNWPVQTSSFSSLRERIWQENSLIMYQE